MNRPYLFPEKNLFKHFKALKHAWTGASVFLDVQHFIVHIDDHKRPFTLMPQFITFHHKQKRQILEFDHDVHRFIGWRPYTFRSIPLLTDKRQFKTWLKEKGCLTPAFSTTPSGLENVLLKNATSAYANLIRGPYRKSEECPFNLETGDFFEAFIEGTITKTWCWNAQPICMEFHTMPTVVGDGQSTIRDLILRHLGAGMQGPNWKAIEAVLTYDEQTLDTVLANASTQRVDFRYASRLSQADEINTQLYANIKQPFVTEQLDRVARCLWQDVIARHHRELLYTIDAILTPDNQLWLLEANANPVVHPLTYPYMAAAMKASS